MTANQEKPSITLVIVTAWLTTMLINRAIGLFESTTVGQHIIEVIPFILRVVLLFLYWGFWISRLFYAKRANAYLVCLTLISNVLLYLVGLDAIKRDQSAPIAVWLIATLQVIGAVVGVGTFVFMKRFHKMGWLVVASLFSACFILGGFLPLLLDHNTSRSLMWLVVIEFVLVIYLSCALRGRKAE